MHRTKKTDFSGFQKLTSAMHVGILSADIGNKYTIKDKSEGLPQSVTTSTRGELPSFLVYMKINKILI